MEANCSLVFFIFGIFLLPKIYSDVFPSLFLTKELDEDHNDSYYPAYKIEYIRDQKNVLKFSELSKKLLCNACPEENATFHRTYALQIQGLVTDFEEVPFEQFIKGFSAKYTCSSPIKPIVLKYKDGLTDESDELALEGAQQYDIGFLIHDKNDKFTPLWDKVENIPEINEYDFITFLNVKMDKSLGTINSVHSVITSGLLLEPDPAPVTVQANENNSDIYGFDVNSLYTKENQVKIFSSIFGQFSSTYYDHVDRTLLKVQLAPHEDFLLNVWKLPSFMDLNTAPMWKQLYPQWKKIEIFVRRVAQDLDELDVTTGTAKILTLPDANGLEQEIYLGEERKLPVSKYFWKLIMFEPDDSANIKAILIVMHNDPYTTNQSTICDVTENFGWLVSNQDYRTGLTYVCPVNESIVSKLYDEFKMDYEIFDLKHFLKLDYGKEGEGILVDENITS